MATNPWLNYHEILAQPMAKIVGAKPSEVVVMISASVIVCCSVSFFLLVVSARLKLKEEVSREGALSIISSTLSDLS